MLFSLNSEVFEFEFLHSFILELLFFLFVVNFKFDSESSLVDVIKNFDESFSDFDGSDESLDGSECFLMGFGVL